MAKLRHIAISVPDPEKSAQFYESALGMKRVGTTNSPLATGVYLSDGVVNMALLKFKSDHDPDGIVFDISQHGWAGISA